jgi:hypothetical protein
VLKHLLRLRTNFGRGLAGAEGVVGFNSFSGGGDGLFVSRGLSSVSASSRARFRGSGAAAGHTVSRGAGLAVGSSDFRLSPLSESTESLKSEDDSEEAGCSSAAAGRRFCMFVSSSWRMSISVGTMLMKLAGGSSASSGCVCTECAGEDG